MKTKNKITIMLFICLIPLVFSSLVIAWIPSASELEPTKDTMVAVNNGNFWQEPENNFGGNDDVEIGDSLKGDLVGAIQFDLSSVPDDTTALSFTADYTNLMTSTEDLLVFIMEEIDWVELSVTGDSNPFDVYNVFNATSGTGNVTKIAITGDSTGTVTVDLTDYKDATLITLLFAGMDGGAWIYFNSKDNEAYASNPPHIEITAESLSSIPGFETNLILILSVTTIFGIIIYKKKQFI